jgi:diaminohydroxyphosphoribosylaminopyrimidine deaminase/5-amino-6-(5-phosphoribosylamino)uracil reductase
MSSPNPDDILLMHRAIRLAMAARGSVEPNPMVGCVIARDGQVVGQGCHEIFGGPHAEPNALAACSSSPRGATAYVTMEPCCHDKKKTPPCVPALIAAGLSRVVVACLDPNPLVAGKGIEQLNAAGIQTTVGILEKSSCQMNAAYFASVLGLRPYVTLKWAQSADGKVSGASGERRVISNSASQRAVHGLRSRSDAVMVAINTVLVDDPLLTARVAEQKRPLLRVVIDRDLRLPPDCSLARTAHLGPVLVYCSVRAYQTRLAAVTALIARHINAVAVPMENNRLSMSAILADLHGRGVTHLLVEPGPGLAKAMMDEKVVDRIWRFVSPQPVDDETAKSATEVDYPIVGEANLDRDRLTEHLNPSSDFYFAPEPSADLLLVHPC